MKDERPFLMAGLWESWRSKEDPDAETGRNVYRIDHIGEHANERSHDRMPVILYPNDLIDGSIQTFKMRMT